MVNLILFGPPGSGKGTQAVKLAERFDLIHLSTGDLFRFNIKNQTELGTLAKSFIDKGELVPDEVTTSMVKDFLETKKDAKGFIFDGYPRTSDQAQALDVLVEEVLDSQINVTLALTVEDTLLEERLLERGKSSGRTDDADISIIKNRIQEYYNKTAPVAEYFKQQEKWIEVNGVGEIDTITESLSEEINLVL